MKKAHSGIIRMMLIHPNVSNRMILIHSNVRKSFKQRTNTLHCFARRRILAESSNNMDGEDFSKENRSYQIYYEIVLLNDFRGTIKRVGQYKLRVLFQELQEIVSLFNDKFRMKIGLQLVKYTPFFLNKWKVEN